MVRRLAFWLLVFCLSLVITGCDFLVDLTSDSQADQAQTQIQESIPPLQLGSGELPETGSIGRTFDWRFGGKEFTWELNLPQSLYDYYFQLPRTPTANYSVYATHPMDDTYLEELVSELEAVALEEGFNPRQTAEFAISFVQSLPYSADSVTTPFDEYPRYPIETLVDMGGDCEDSSILLASLLNMMDYNAVFLVFPGTANESGHAAIGVAGLEGVFGSYWEHEGKRYYYQETTGTGWKLGEVPPEYKKASADIYDLTPVAIITHQWQATSQGDRVEMTVTIENLGTAEASGIYIQAGFDAGDDMLWNIVESQPFNLAAGHSIVISLTLREPANKHTRLIVNIVDDGLAVDKSYSEWFDT
ncbi:MAG: hypothetical protein KAI14_02035 [Dehalococcoidales bacterium]|nr:hypothetical protein [Dehalococcoidales bacterium]